tara:strand:- start:33 stop:566 length:534 start_codon:yes stop_codon:yes gene_type:complete
MPLLTLKALHIIFIVTWFAGLFYIVRLFIYQREAQNKEENESEILTRQFKIMSRRLWLGIAWPSAFLTAITGPWLLYKFPGYIEQPWMHLKLTLVVLLYGYHLFCHKIFYDQQRDRYNLDSTQLRIWNEVATLFLFAIVFLVVCKSLTNWTFYGWGLSALAFALLGAIIIINRNRNK